MVILDQGRAAGDVSVGPGSPPGSAAAATMKRRRWLIVRVMEIPPTRAGRCTGLSVIEVAPARAHRRATRLSTLEGMALA